MPLTYSLVSGTLPPGVSIDPSTGILRGLTQLDNPPIWATNAGTVANVAELSTISVQLAATANGTGGTISYCMVPIEDNANSALPFGVTISSTGLISGNVGEVADDYSLPWTDSQLPSWTTNSGTLASFSEQTTISNISLVATARSSVNATISRYSVFSGALPFGLLMNPNGVIYGTTPEDTSGSAPDITPKPVWVTLAGTLGFVNESSAGTFTVSANASGNATISRYIVTSGALPFGMLLTATTGVISGTVGEVTDATEAQFPISDPPTWVTAAGSLGTFANGSVVSRSISATAYSGRTMSAYAISSDILPYGLLLTASSGAIAGTINAPAGTYTFTAKAIDSSRAVAYRSFSITVT